MLISDIEHYLQEDLGFNDVSCTLVPDMEVHAVIFAKEDCTLAGLDIARSFFDYLGINAETEYDQGNTIREGDVIFSLRGSSVSILRAERVVLNFLGHLCGIATLTRKCVNIVRNFSDAKIACTRKTTPGIREHEKMAVIAGGGDPHRFNLSDAVMIKDNHIKMMGIESAVGSARKRASFTQKIEVEVESTEDALLAARLGADIIMLDNMDPGTVIETMAALKKASVPENIVIEVSGGIGPENLEEYAKTGVHVISMGSLIHQARWVDISLEFLS
ncbi:carboxylating nicotinate-nucleotide diphosphorylase [Methanolobus halotolerans]|uniref:Nicotinate-nucleotide pyrophosphorylase [carboxylating] n=1 Tax=Methanolobus halotolerans TaxID=2052935 RepID=A0A4E0QS53_9EURY|nr:carboxylating nicotinate-nucleotide diphosphorylase [Methanolobus halotolerans]TGC09708.1 nicotinate-nucleotide diphosphorylase (carboxylating) [Methanolobus halotolerans]